MRDLIKDKEGYIEAMAVWLATWPTEQFMIIQVGRMVGPRPGRAPKRVQGVHHCACRSGGQPLVCLLRQAAGVRPFTNHTSAQPCKQPQFENLTADASHTAVLNDVMRFVDIDPSKGPQELPQANSRKGDVNPEGWKMKKAEFMELLSYAQPLSER